MKKMLMAAAVAACAACGAYDWDYRVQYVRIPKGSYSIPEPPWGAAPR